MTGSRSSVKARQVVDVLLAVGREEILKDFRRDSCIASTRIALDVLEHFHVEAAPLAVRAMVFNAPFADRLRRGQWPANAAETRSWSEEDGSWSVGIGFGHGGPGKWPAHLVALVRGRWLLDLSIDQADRLENRIVLGPLAAEATAGFFVGCEPLVVEWGELLVRYELVQPPDRGYERSRDWRLRSRRMAAVRRIVGRVRAELEGGA